MKRTENIQKDAFRKGCRSYRLAPVALAISAAFILAGCEQTDETVLMYQNADARSAVNPSMSDHCPTAYNKSLKKEENTTQYNRKEDCSAEFREAQGTPVPAQAVSAEQSIQTSSSWMPLMTGYMIGRMMSGGVGFAQKPTFPYRSPASPANGQFMDTTGKSYRSSVSNRTMTVPKIALSPKSETTNTITRGGFGERVANQNSMQRSSIRTGSSFSSRSMGG
ncbi:MAG: DUF1190 family protein [Candidatus Malihini olakiniferum]